MSTQKKTGIQLIKAERKEQIVKHKFSLEKYDKFYTKRELVQAARHCLERVGRGPGFASVKYPWPNGWGKYFEDKIRFKDDIGKLTVAGAFFMAENDRLKSKKHQSQIERIAKRIDKLLAL